MKISPISTSPAAVRPSTEVPVVQAPLPPEGRFDQLLQSVNDLLQNKTLQAEIQIKKNPTTSQMQKLLTLQEKIQKVHLGVEVISRINESVLSMTRKVQNG
jgi:hypothetical protein